MLRLRENIKCIKRHDRFIKGLSYEIDDIVPFDDGNSLIMIKSYVTLSTSVYVFSFNNHKDYECFEDYFISKKELLNKKLKKVNNA